METVLAKARELADAILDSDAFKELRQLEARVLQNSETTKVLQEYDGAINSMRAKEEQQAVVTPEEKHAVKALEEKIAANGDLQNLMRAQARYHHLMQAVNNTIHATLEPPTEEAEKEEGESAGGGRIILP